MRTPTTPEREAEIAWAQNFHIAVMDILASRGFKEIYGGHIVSNLEFLTEGRIKKVANECKRVLEHYVTSVNYELIQLERVLQNRIKQLEYEKEKELNRWFFTRKEKLVELCFQAAETNKQLEMIGNFRSILACTKPRDLNPANLDAPLVYPAS